MRKSRRQIVIRLLELAALGLVSLDLVLYFAVYKPLRSMVAAEQQQYSEVRAKVREAEARLGRLEKFRDALPGAGQQLADFAHQSVPPRRRGFSTAAHLIHEAATAAGVETPGILYRLDSTRHDPLAKLGLEITTDGSYPGLLKFAHTLETTNDLLLIRGFTMAAAENGSLSLKLAADLYVTP